MSWELFHGAESWTSFPRSASAWFCTAWANREWFAGFGAEWCGYMKTGGT